MFIKLFMTSLNLISVKESFHDIFKKTLNITPVNITSFTVHKLKQLLRGDYKYKYSFSFFFVTTVYQPCVSSLKALFEVMYTHIAKLLYFNIIIVILVELFCS